LRDIARTRVTIICSIQSQTVLPVGFGPDIKIDVRLLPPEQVRRHGDVSLLYQFITGRADVSVHAEQFLENDHSRRG
jgi:hypothetical protein